jgi:hypothetical protein
MKTIASVKGKELTQISLNIAFDFISIVLDSEEELQTNP